MAVPAPDLMTIAEIAAEYGQSKSAVATLRARDTSFPEPQPVARGRNLLYARPEVQQWARGRGWAAVTGPTRRPLQRLEDLPDTSMALIAAMGCSFGADAVPADIPTTDLLSLLSDTLHDRDGDWYDLGRRSGATDLLHDAAEVPANSDLALLDDLRAESPAAWGDVMDDALARATRDHAGRIVGSASSIELVEWMTSATGAASGTVLDPACGTGLLLSRVLQGAGQTQTHAIGIDDDDLALRVSALRALAHAQPIELRRGDALATGGPSRSYTGACDLVVGDVPSGPSAIHTGPVPGFVRPPTGEQAFRWLALAVTLLRPGGRAVLSTPARTLDGVGRAEKFRRTLLRMGAVAAIITLPKGMRPGSAPELALWVMTSTHEQAPRPILTIDGALLAQELGTPHTSAPARDLMRAVLEAFLQLTGPGSDQPIGNVPLELPPRAPADAFRIIHPTEQVARDFAISVAPWSASATPLIHALGSTSTARAQATRRRHDALEALEAARDQLESVYQALRERQRDDEEATAATVTQLLRSGDLLLFDVTSDDSVETLTPSFSFPANDVTVPPARRAADGDLATALRSGDVAIARSDTVAGPRYEATICPGDDPTPPLPEGTRRILRPRSGQDDITPENVALAVNAVATTGWPQGSRGDLDIERAFSYIRVPSTSAEQLGIDAVLTLRSTLTPVLDELADPTTWS